MNSRAFIAQLAVPAIIAETAGCGLVFGPPMSHIRACGTTIYQGRNSLVPLRLAPVTHGSAQAPAAPSTSVLPPMGPAPLGGSGDRPILTSSDCEHGPTIVVTNAGKARTLAIAHTEDGGIAGLDLVITTTPVTIYAYTGHRLTSGLRIPAVATDTATAVP